MNDENHHYVVLIYCAECYHDQDPGGCFGCENSVMDGEPTTLQETVKLGMREVRRYAPHDVGHPIEFDVRDGAEDGEVVFSSEFDGEYVSRNGEILDCDAILEKRAHRLEWEGE